MINKTLSKRDAGKESRRARVCKAAAELIRRNPSGMATMADISCLSGVSERTIYNLFGTRDNIFSRIFHEDSIKFENNILNNKFKNSIDKIYKSIDIAFLMYENDINFYRCDVWYSAWQFDQEMRVEFNYDRVRIWKLIIEEAERSGYLDVKDNLHLASQSIIYLWRGAMSDWIGGHQELDQFRSSINFGITSFLLSWSTAIGREEIMNYVRYNFPKQI